MALHENLGEDNIFRAVFAYDEKKIQENSCLAPQNLWQKYEISERTKMTIK